MSIVLISNLYNQTIFVYFIQSMIIPQVLQINDIFFNFSSYCKDDLISNSQGLNFVLTLSSVVKDDSFVVTGVKFLYFVVLCTCKSISRAQK